MRICRRERNTFPLSPYSPSSPAVGKALSSLPSLSHALGEVMVNGVATSHMAPAEEGPSKQTTLCVNYSISLSYGLLSHYHHVIFSRQSWWTPATALAMRRCSSWEFSSLRSLVREPLPREPTAFRRPSRLSAGQQGSVQAP